MGPQNCDRYNQEVAIRQWLGLTAVFLRKSIDCVAINIVYSYKSFTYITTVE